MSDNVLLLSYVRDDAEIKRAIAVVKTRASEHDPGIREFTITGRHHHRPRVRVAAGDVSAGS